MGDMQYIAGACNIGPAETALRRRVGWVALGAAVLLLAVLVALGVSPWWRLLVALPATVSAAGFLQARRRFCVAYGRRGVFNVGAVGETRRVADEESRVRDRRTANQIIVSSVLVGVVFALVSVAIG